MSVNLEAFDPSSSASSAPTDFQLAAFILSRQGYLRFTGGSMFPVLQAGDLVCPSIDPGRQPVPGDLVAFCQHGQVWIHRVMNVEETYLLTRGDARFQFDAPVARQDVLGALDGLYEPHAGRTVPFHGQRAFYNTIFRRLAGCQPWQARTSWFIAALLRKFSRQRLVCP